MISLTIMMVLMTIISAPCSFRSIITGLSWIRRRAKYRSIVCFRKSTAGQFRSIERSETRPPVSFVRCSFSSDSRSMFVSQRKARPLLANNRTTKQVRRSGRSISHPAMLYSQKTCKAQKGLRGRESRVGVQYYKHFYNRPVRRQTDRQTDNIQDAVSACSCS